MTEVEIEALLGRLETLQVALQSSDLLGAIRLIREQRRRLVRNVERAANDQRFEEWAG